MKRPRLDLLYVYARSDVDHSEPDGCWIWRGSTNANGYPLLHTTKADGTRTSIGARRFVYLQYHGKPVPPGRYLTPS